MSVNRENASHMVKYTLGEESIPTAVYFDSYRAAKEFVETNTPFNMYGLYARIHGTEDRFGLLESYNYEY